MFKKQRNGSLKLFPFMLFGIFLLLAFVLPYFQPSLAVTMRPENGHRANTSTTTTRTTPGTASTLPGATTPGITPTATSSFPPTTLPPTPFQPSSTTTVPTLHPTATTVAPTTSQPKVTCYQQGHPISPPALTSKVYPYPPSAPWFTTTSSCADINVNFSRLSAPIQMQVCFIRTQTCNSWKTISSTGTWYQIATTVLDGTTYRFGIKTTQTATVQGVIAD